METYRSQLTGKTYRVDTWTQPLLNEFSGKPEQYYRQVAGVINGKVVLLDTPVSTECLRSAHFSMMACIERFLEGKHDVTHYRDFPEIAEAKNS